MEQGLRALRQLSAGLGNEAAVFKAASLVPADSWESPQGQAPQGRSPSGSPLRQGSDSESEDDSDTKEAVQLSELYTWGRATNYQLGYGVSGNEQQIPKLVQLPIGRQVTSPAQTVKVAADGLKSDGVGCLHETESHGQEK